MFDFLANKFSSIFKYVTGQSRLTEANIAQTLEKVHEAFIDADVPVHVAQQFIQELKQDVLGQKVIGSVKAHEQFMKLVYDRLVKFLGQHIHAESPIALPARIMVMGLQGSGKTTSIIKLARHIKHVWFKNKPVVVAVGSVDYCRPAAVQQLEIMAERENIEVIHAQSSDPVQAADNIFKQARERNIDVMLLDTAGRLHVNQAMLNELKAIESRVQPTEKLLVLDAMTGQLSLKIARTFNEQLGFSAAILAKLDSDTRAGSALAFRYELKKPIWFVGTGEKVEDFEPFKPERVASRMIGMGDLQTLAERATQKIHAEEQKQAEKAMFSDAGMTLQDFLAQLQMMNKMGSLSQLIGYLPGAAAQGVNQEKIEQAEQDIKKFKAILSSMTRKERIRHKLLERSRKSRIARGAGVQVRDIDLLLQRFEQMRQFAKLLKKGGNATRFFG